MIRRPRSAAAVRGHVLERFVTISDYARQLLRGAQAPAAGPIRSELFGLHRFQEHGRSLARAQPVSERPARGEPPFFPRVEDNLDALRRAFDYIALTSQAGRYIAPAAEWLLDNFHLVEAQLQQIREGVPRSYYQRLPKLSEAPLAGLPRIYGIAWAYVAHTDSVLNPELFIGFLDAYQEVDELHLGELWAFPTTLRVVLLENLRRAAERIAGMKVAREVAHIVWDMADVLTEHELDTLERLMESRGLRDSYLVQLWQRLPAERPGSPNETPPALVHWTERHGANGPLLLEMAQAGAAADNLTVGNIITTLRTIAQVDWAALIEPVSRSLRALRQLPSYSQESEITRQQITQAMEQMARVTRRTERQVAESVVDLAQSPDTQALPDAQARATAGYYLIGPGSAALREMLRPAHAPPGAVRAAQQPSRAWRLPLYLGCLAGGTGLLVAALAHGMLREHGAIGWMGAVALLLAAWPLSEAVIAVVHRIVAESARVQPLPRLDFAEGIPQAHRVLVVIPTLLGSAQGIAELVRRLELHWLANREQHAQFALLSDFGDADSAQMPQDDELLEDAARRIDELNQRYPVPQGMPTRFLLMHRPRVWSTTERCWMGWERKRGKLEMLLRWLATGDGGGFLPMPQAWRLADGIPYVVTLDADTGLPPGSLRELVSTAAHPLNTPQFDAASRRVVAGFGMLQPHVVTPFPARDTRSWFHWLFAGQCGIDPYSSGASNIYQDLFGAGSFTGKGLLNVQAVHAVLDRRLPDGVVLSHDLLEGTVARCALMSDVVLLEDHPQHAGVAASRIHRWTRGDWQLLPIMARPTRFGIDSLGLWKMLDNLRRALVVPVSALLLAWVVFTGAMPLGWALAVVAASVALGPLLGALAGLVPTRRGIELRHFFDVGSVDLLRAMAGTAWQLATLLAQSRLLLDATARALWRMAVSRRQLLQWTSSTQAQAQARYSLGAFLRADPWTCAVGAVLAIAALAWGAYPLAGAAIFAVWACAPLLAWWGSRPAAASSAQARAPNPQETQYLQGLARDTWKFFEDVVGEDDNHLPPDNLQLEPQPTVAHRTSPTNIGMYLLSTCCAREFGWIDSAQLLARLDATLRTVERLEHFHGHLYNWYDTQTLQVLRPAYVSSVDSGNFAGHLLCVAQACRSFAAKPGQDPREDAGEDHVDHHVDSHGEALEAMAQRCEAMCHAMDFRGLYDTSRHLFHIGLRVQDMALDASYYDLLASESRLLSFLAIAKGDVPRRHWQALGRPFLSVDFRPGLKSWAGSMFEYLMPALVMPEPAHSLLDVANRCAILEQERLGSQRAQPWGVSESAYFAQDHSLAYQYSPFGVPRLALRRTPPDERVVAPYASVMATPFAPQDCAINLQKLQALGARGDYGFFDAVDFTASRQPHGQAFSVVHNFMAHHQGMSLVALCNVLQGGAPRRWFASAPLVEAYEALLHERTPRQIIGSADPRPPPAPSEGDDTPAYQPRTVDPLAAGLQPTHLLSNGRYTVALRANGAGVSRWRSSNVTRWRDDALRDAYGTFIYVREEGGKASTAAPVSLTALPAPGAGWRYRARFLADQVRFDASGDDLQVRTSVLISPEDDTELRTVSIHNTSHAARTLELISYFEPVLSQPRHDEAHPAFANLFVQSNWQPEWRTLLLTRKARLQGEAAMSVAHFVAAADAQILSVECMADRRAFIGRNRTLASPALQAQALDGDGQPINGLDPIACLRVRFRIEGDATARITFATTADEAEDNLLDVIDRYLQPMHVERATRMAATLAQVRLRDLSIAPPQIAALQDLTSILTYTTPRMTSERQLFELQRIWRLGISGDKPIVLVRIHASDGMRLLDTLMRAQPWWGFGGVACDLVVINGEPDSYLMPVQREIEGLRNRVAHQVQNSFPRNDSAGFYLLRDKDVADSEKAALSALARAVFAADGRPLEAQVAVLRDALAAAQASSGQATPTERAAVQALGVPSAMADDARTVQGRFDGESGEFCFDVGAGQHTARPWINVIANPGFGFLVSESGSGFSWAGNSRMHQLTPWSNDPVQDPAFEHYLLQDTDTRAMVPLTPASSGAAGVSHRVRHGQGYTVFEARHMGLESACTFFADAADSVKVVQVRVKNTGGGVRRLRAAAMVEWQMGPARGARRTITSSKAAHLPAMLAQQRESGAGLHGSTAFLMLTGTSGQSLQWTGDRQEFFVPGTGTLTLPDTLGQRTGSGLDACAAVADDLVLAAGQGATFSFVLGHGASAEAAQQLAERWAVRDTQQSLDGARAFWDELLGRVEVKTPDPLFDALVNRWLPYQTLGCRMWARAGFYQAGGAFGFRDQLQDAMAFALSDPARLRDQIMLNASRQFPEGDVQHWWHMPGGAGVRTHFSDDLLWLPYACAHYIEVNADAALLDEVVPFIEGAGIPAGAEDAYYTPAVSEQAATVYEHCARAIDRSLASGTHGLPLMGTGDWNDGMNRVGHEGRGESVWLAWFLCDVIERFAPIAQQRRQDSRAKAWLDARQRWIRALHEAGWDGAWFRRAFFDDGSPLGSSANEECRIDLIAQAWSVISRASSDEYMDPAMRAVGQQLTDADAGLLRLLTPPLANAVPEAGYIQAYPPGVRENGGQYSHGAVWAMMAQALRGDLDAAWESFRGLSPAHRAADARRAPAYEIEPYVMPGDTYSAPPYVGRGGWSWYSGSAAWMHRAAIGTLLGLEVRGDRLRLTPRVPPDWPAFQVVLRLQGRELVLSWSRENGKGGGEAPSTQAIRDGEWLMWKRLPDGAVVHVSSAVEVAA